MSLRDEIAQLWDDAQKQIDAHTPPRGVAPRESDPSPANVALNENFRAVHAALNLIADRIDALESTDS